MAQSLFLRTTCAHHFDHSVRPRNSQSVGPVLFPVNLPWQLLLLFPIFSALACVPALAQGWDKDKALAPSVIVDLGTPQIWTMEQAHYLLERNRALDLGLQEQNPNPLNPNDTAGVRASALQTLFSGSVSFDAALGAKNRAAVTQFNSQVAQYNALYSQRAVYFAQQAAVAGALAGAQNQLATLQAAPTQDAQAIAQQQLLISQLTAQNTMLTSEITSLDSVIGTAPTVPNISTSAPADETTATALGGNSTFDNIVKGFNTGPGASKLSASVQLDNYVNFQYEIVAKQLTLLQDQAGPNSRVLFVELPHSIYVTDKLHLYPYFGGLWGHHLVQSWWTIGGALQVKPLNEWAVENGAHRPPTLLEAIELNKNFAGFAKTGTASIMINELKRLDDIHDANVKQLNDDATATINDLETKKKSLLAPAPASPESIKETPASKKAPKCNCSADSAAERTTIADLSVREKQIVSQLNTDLAQEKNAHEITRQKLADAQTAAVASATAAQSPSSLALNAFLSPYSSTEDHQTDAKASASPISGNFNIFPGSNKNTEDQTDFDAWASYWLYGAIGRETGTPGSESAPIYALDLIPRQSSLNVAEANASTRQIGFAGVFSWLSGLGARARYERQKQEFSQYTQVETYATAFGKGDFTFGWTFGPNPGTKQIGAGLRTTYAILVVPKDTRVVRLNAIGCGYRRREVPRDPFALAAKELKDPEKNGLHTWTGPTAQNKLDSEDCGSLRRFDVDVPNSDDDFWVENAQYTPVPAGQRVTLKISGRFGDTVGVLVNGTPLQKVPSITQPLLTPPGYTVPANAGDAGTQGVFEIVHIRNPKTDTIGSDIVASFTMPAAFAGTPKITIVSAARDKLVNEVPSGNKLFKGNHHLLDDDPAGPMFYVLPAVTRVDADYSNDTDTIVKIVGRGFDTRETSSVVFGADALTLHTDPATSLAAGEYQVLANGAIIQARVKREKYFPQWSIDYVSQLGKQVVDATITRDDSVGPVVADPGCTFLADTAKDGNLPVKLAVKGKFFSSSMTPAIAVAGKPLSATSFTQQFVSANEWGFTATVPVGTSQIAVSFTPAPATKNLARTVVCSAPPAKKVLKAKAPNKPAPRPAATPETHPVTKNPPPPASTH